MPRNGEDIGRILERGRSSVLWEIPGFSGLPKEEGIYFWTPYFHLAESRWGLVIFPNGTKEFPGRIVLGLLRNDDGPAKTFDCRVGVRRADGEEKEVGRQIVKLDFKYDDYILFPFYKRAEEFKEGEFLFSDNLTLTLSIREESEAESQDKTSRETKTEVLEQTTDRQDDSTSPEAKELKFDSTTYPCLESLSCDLSKQMDENAYTDVQLICRHLTIRAHKLILAARSEVFRSMLRSDMLEGRKGVVEIVDMEPKILKIFIRYVYSGTLPALTEDAILSLYEAADKYKIDGLRERTSHLLSATLSQENALRILVIADAHGDEDLKRRVFTYILDENIPRKDVNWLNFCNDYPKLVVEIFNCQLFNGSQ